MASLTKKIINGRPYYYVRECKRVDGKPKVVKQTYLGTVENIMAAVAKHKNPSALPQPLTGQGSVIEVGASATFYELAKRLDLAGIVDRHVPKKGRGPSVGTYLLVAVLNRCVAPCSKSKIAHWFESTVLKRILPLKPQQLTSQRFWDNLDRISPEAIAKIEDDLIQRMVDAFDLDVNRLLFDGTNFFTFIDTFNEKNSLAQRAKSKEGRSSLRVVGLALLVTPDFNIPLFHHTYPANQHDATTFGSLTNKLVQRCKQFIDTVDHITLVFDKGNNSKSNFQAIDDTPYHFVGSLVPSQHADLLQIPLRKFTSLSGDGFPGLMAFRTVKTVFGQKRTVVVTHNEKLFVTQCKTLLREIGKRQQKFQDLVARLGKWHSGQYRGRNPPTSASVKKAVSSWLKARHMKDLFQYQIDSKQRFPVLTYSFNQSAWEDLQATLLGKTILFTDNHNWSDTDIISAYRSQHHVENAFRQMKNVQHIALRPQHCWTDQKIRVHVFTCVIALALLNLLRRFCQQRGLDLSIDRTLQLLANIQEIHMVFPPLTPQGEPTLRTTHSSLSDEQAILFDLLELHRYF